MHLRLPLMALLGLAHALDGKCTLGEKAKYTGASKPGGASISLLAAAPAAASWGDEGVEGLRELHTMGEVDQVVSTQPCMIMFYAEWCPHCKRMKPIYTQVARDAHSKDMGVAFYMVNADAYRDIGNAYGVDGFPTIKFFHGQALDHTGVEYEGGENLPPERLTSFAQAQHAKAKSGVMLASVKAAPAVAALAPEAVAAAAPAGCDASVCDNLQCPEGWQTGFKEVIGKGCQCRCLKRAGAKAAKVRAKAAAKARAAASRASA